ncbi:MAG: right-handed parallel beta-helix repeat-containing protein [Oscillospiraceae bacterium]|nr:right-handed parallel beta-helix repeat-containing protein [Oscillospiraceae bacterium]
MKLKRILAMVLCVAMVLSMMGTSVFAEGDTPVVTAVAKIGETEYASVADALSAAQDGDVVNLIWEESDDPIAMNGSVYGKSVTITGTATVDWSKGNLFVGRGGEGDGTVIFDGANLASASDQASTGIHVSGREKETSNKYNGTLIIKNSTIELDYLINRGTINVDNSMLTVKKGFGIAGRPASETESGEAATATINITNNSYVKVLNHNGMGIGVASATPEGKGILNLTDSTFECASFNVDADLGDFNVSGESTLKIAALTGKEINLLDGTILKDSIVGGHVLVLGVVTFRGDNTVALVEDYGNAYSAVGANWTVEAGASLTMTEKARWGFGYGDKATIIGTLTDASTARESLTEDDISLFTHGFVAMSSWDVAHSLVVKDAYVVIGDNNSFGNTSKSGYKGTYDIDFDNAVMDASRITFYEAGSKTDLSFVDSDVKVGTFMTRDKDSTFTLTNTKLLSTTDSNGTDEGNYHAGTMTLNNSDITYSAPLVMENGTLMLGISSNITAPVITGAGVITVDASELKNGSVTVINADMSGFTGTVTVTNNDDASYKITDAGLVVSVEAPSVPTSTLTNAYTSENTYWGECGGNASESFVFKFYHNDTYMGYTSLNNIGGIIDGDVYVSWHIKLDTASNTDEYWDMAWEIAPTLDMQPNRVEHWVDGVKAAECVIEPNWSDSIHPVVAAVAEAHGKIVKYVNNLDGNTLENALTNAQDGQTVALLRDVKLSDMVMLQKAITIDGNGFSIKPADASKAYNSAIYFYNAAIGTIKDVVFDGWKSDHVIRIQSVADAKVDTVTIKNSNQTSGLALISSTFSNTEITNSTFVDNTCLKVIDINSWGDGSTETAKVSDNTFKNNTTTSTGVIYYAVGGGFELSDNTFELNTVNANGHGSVVYFSEGANCSVTGNTFKNNAVTATDKRAGGALVLEAGTAVSGNAFIGNTASSAEFAAQVLYKADEGSAAIDLSDNYWGGEEPGAADYATVKGAPITVGSYYATINEDGTLAGLVTLANPVAKIGDVEYASVADALADAKAKGLTDVTITLVGETTKESTDSFDLAYTEAFDKVTFKQEDPAKVYYLDGIYTGKRTNSGDFVFDGVNIVVTGQYMFEGNVRLTNNSVIKSVAEANCFIYYSVTTVEPGSKLQGVIEDLRGGTLIVDGGRNDGEFNATPDMQDSILTIRWSGDSMTLKNGAYVKINAANEVGRLTVNSGTSLNVYASKLDSYQWIENNGTINTDVNSLITTKELKGAGVINVDASELKNGSATVINADMSDFTGTVSVTNNDDATYAITDAGLVISVVANASVTDSEGNVSYYATLSDALSAAQDGDTITLLADAVLEDTVTIKKSITLDGNGYTITQSAECNNEWALLYFDDEAVLDVTIKNVTFDGIKDGAAVRTLGANITIDNCVFQNCQHTQVQGLVRLTQGSATIKNSKFLDNTCSMVVSFNYDTAGLAGDKLTVENCVFDGNTANSTAVIYYVKGAGCEIKNSQFKNNTVNCANNGATIYLGFQENCTVTGNLFENNSVTDSSTSTRVGGAIFFGYEANISGNAFINNTASNANGDTLGQLCTSTYYECDINLGGNYWGGDAPVYGKDYTVQHQTGDATFTLDTYNASYSLDEDGNVVVGDATDISYVAKVGKLGYETLASALSDAQDGQTIALLANIVLENAVSITKTVTLDLNGFELTYNSTTQGEAMITNKGNLTINDSVGTGVINYNYTGAADSSYGKGNYTISNAGTLTVNGGKITIANLSGHAKYPIDNNSTTGDAVLVINGGHLYNYNTSAIRQFCNSTTYKNSVTVNGGLVEGYCAIWVQNPGAKTVNGSLVITGGEVKSTAKAYVNGTADLKDVSSAIYCTIAGNGGAWSNDSLVSITGGTINENVRLAEEAPAKINVNENICNGYVTVPAPEVPKNLVLFDYPIVEIEGKEYYRVAVASGIKSTSYAKVGFEVTIGDAEAVELYSTVVYKNMTATFDGVDTTIPASEFGAGSQYINFTNLYFNKALYEASTPLTIRPFAVKFNGDYEYGKETTIDAIYTLGN